MGRGMRGRFRGGPMMVATIILDAVDYDDGWIHVSPL